MQSIELPMSLADVHPGTGFTPQHLQRLVDLGGAALQVEDGLIRTSVLAREILRVPFGGLKPRFGIRRVENERSYQYLIWRALLNDFEFLVDIEREGNHDFVIWDCANHPRKIVAVGEMKRWVSVDGCEELPRIELDIRKLKLAEREGVRGFILLATAFRVGSLAEQEGFLYDKLKISAKCLRHYKFESLYEGASDRIEFGLLGFMASDSMLA
ncbi:MAG: hypothetical protein ABI693_05695 [Bryobacteraceae bacterium]